jgi:hypothetical protein
VYALGVVLYELLCGQLPYDVSRVAIYEATRVIREEPPAKLSTINRKLRGDLETIALKALEKDRERRYQSAGDLARDINRHLNREPIEARAPSRWTRALRWARRHPLAATATGCSVFAASVIGATIGSVWWVNKRPYEIQQNQDGTEVRLLARSGNILESWTARENRVSVPAIEQKVWPAPLKRPRELGGGRMLLLGFGKHGDLSGRYEAGLYAFNVDESLREPIWESEIRTEDIPPAWRESRGFVGEEFGVDMIFGPFDIFPDAPGQELVVLYSHDFSRRAVRIYDLAGRILYQVWHDGGITSFYWLSEAKVLVCASEDARKYWRDLGFPSAPLDLGPTIGRYPLVVFAIRPQIVEKIEPTILDPTPGNGPHDAVWFKYLLPADERNVARRVWVKPPRPQYDARRHAQVCVQVGDPSFRAHVYWMVDAAGEEIAGSRFVGDGYNMHRDELPDPEVFHLGPLPPIVTETMGD